MMWAEKYIGWSSRSVSEDETCWDFVVFVMKDHFGIELPTYKVNSINMTIEAEKISERWTKVEYPEYGDLVLMIISGRTYHIGIMVDRLHMLHHRVAATGAVVERLKGGWWRNRIEGFYRYAPR